MKVKVEFTVNIDVDAYRCAKGAYGAYYSQRDIREEVNSHARESTETWLTAFEGVTSSKLNRKEE